MKHHNDTIDANEAVARIAYKINEVIAIYPITPASVMGELCDLYASHQEKNILGTVPDVIEMQSEGGASGAVHGALQSGALTTTFTASQGLLLMMPNMYKIAGELTPTVFHIAARSIAAQALSIFGDHSDVMSVRQTGFAMLCSNSVQEAHDMTLISQAATLKSRIPFLHFFDGFRTSHEVDKIELLEDETIHSMLDAKLIQSHRERGLSPDHPFIRGTSQNPDVYFQGRESVNSYYAVTPQIVQECMEEFAKLTGREYQLFDYIGAKDAERIIILMGSGAEAVHETVEYLNQLGEKVGILKVHLYRPFSIEHFLSALPKTLKSIAVLDRTKEAGSVGEPLYLDVVSALNEAKEEGSLAFDTPFVIGGRYGLSSKEFTPAMIKAVFDELKKEKPKIHFTVGIYDDVTHTSLEYDPSFTLPKNDTFEAIFFGLGSDGTVGANKNSIKIIGTQTSNYAQGYFVYDSKKSGSMTTSHLRFGPYPIRSTYLIDKADFVACHQSVFMEKFDILQHAKEGAVFLLNTPFDKEHVWAHLPRSIQQEMIEKNIKFYIVDGYKVARESGMNRRINTVMQTCFFAISGVLEPDEAIKQIKKYIEKSYGKKSKELVELNFKAVDHALSHLFEVQLPKEATGKREFNSPVKGKISKFVADVTSKIIEGEGDALPVSMIPADGTWPSSTTQFEKRDIALEIPVWDPSSCVQCNECVLVCPHAVIRAKLVDDSDLIDLPESFKAVKTKGKSYLENGSFTLQVSAEDCTGCSLCTEVCIGENKEQEGLKAINMTPMDQIDKVQEEINWEYFLNLPEFDRNKLNHAKVKESQFLQPLFEFSGACPGCGETPYIKLATQLFGDRMIVANATGCSSIYGGNLPTTPWAKNKDGLGPAWSNSLFEDNAEFGLGFRLTIDKHEVQAKELLQELRQKVGEDLSDEILNAQQSTEEEIFAQRARVQELKNILKVLEAEDDNACDLLSLADYLVKKSVWIIGGDGWAYDIGYGGLDHVLASGKNVNILVLDTQVYSNTGGQQSKATPEGAVAKFAASGKPSNAKDLALMAMSYENVYVSRVAMGANYSQTLKAFTEAEAYEGVSIIIAYSHCIAHGYDLKFGMDQQKLAVDCGLWPMFRYNPELIKEGKNPMHLDYKGPKIPVKEYMYNETRFSMVHQADATTAEEFLNAAEQHAQDLFIKYSKLAEE
ncbi:pyruvate:ferredoxin (flavodoxin) oxidoreductase [Sulfurimonas sp. C5]|uniref:pyruvate:ferredoxin (flavodoxin) oxidoreductase n=1 Tax=Sulfurimonas sp. C5 TaxID=3036947 RepID=UPI002456E1C4|nr:pyruvate:ferredoxin (flavodoxin) oxidoreductase [Sulfurimonas sp. C5]MDH4943859.1 pyruvate:ferredoxin (flavodoxin) oxidoreductase [Sulfurimonas sp. C5]